MKLSESILKEWCDRIPRGFPTVENQKFQDEDLKILKEVILQEIAKPKLQEARMWAHTDKLYIPNKNFESTMVDALGDRSLVKSMYEAPLQYNDSPTIKRNSMIVLIRPNDITLFGKVSDIENEISKIPSLEREISSLNNKSKSQMLENKIKNLKGLKDMLDLKTDHTVWETEAAVGYLFFHGKQTIHTFTELKGEGSGEITASSTELKESMVGYAYKINTEELVEIIDILKDNGNSSLVSLGYAPYEIPDSEKYFNIDISEYVTKLYNKRPSMIDTKEKKQLLNSFSSALTIKEYFDKDIVDRGKTIFEAIRNKATSLIKDQDLRVDKDKWCPADIYLYSNPNIINQINEVTTLTGPTGLNSFFADDVNDEEKIVAVSLKEELALQGKSTNIVKVSKNLDIPDREFDKLRLDKDIRTYLESIEVGVKTVLNKYGLKTPKSVNLGGLLGQGRGIPELKEFKPNGKPNPNFNKAAYNELTKFSELQKSKNQKYIDHYNKYKNRFYDIAAEYNATPPTYSDQDIPIDTIIKKAGVYKFAIFVSNEKFFEQIKKALSKKEVGRQTMAQYTNPFVALCAYAIGISGLNPTFWKVTGKSDGTPGSIMKLKGDTVLKIDAKQELEVVDNQLSTDMSMKYIVSSKIEDASGKKNKRYSVTISFRYDINSIRVEVNEFKEKK